MALSLLLPIAFIFGIRIGFIRAKQGYKHFLGDDKDI